ncbi:MAG: signal peptidase I [Brevundimonas sp.]|nr:signal peptidase I [Brevundimonas sp.]
MSDEHKPHDDHGHGGGHGHDDHGHAAPDAHGHDDHGHAAPAAHGHDDHGHAAPEAHGHDDHGHAEAAAHGHDDHAHVAGHGHDDHGHAAPAADGHDDHGHAETAAHGHDDHAHDAGHGHDDHGHAAPAAHGHDDHGHAEAAAHGHDDHAHDAHGHDDHAAPAAHGHDDHGHEAGHGHDDHAAPVAAVAVAGAAAAAASKPPVWSDSGDAPFEDVDATPVYARGKGGKRKSKGSGNEGLEIFKTIFFALLIALVLRVLLFQPFTIPSASMEPNLYEGDYIVVSKWTYGYSKHSIPFSPPVFDGRVMLPGVSHEPRRGDIVVFKLPRDNETDYIKRLIGLPGDRIQMIDNVLFINGTAVRDVEMSRQDVQNLYGTQLTIQLRETLPEGRQINIQDWGPGNISDNTPVFEVPAGHYFMIGDNRDNSQDSRYDRSAGVGYVPAENLIGKAEIILFSWSPGASLWNPVSWFSKIRPSRFFTVLD